MQALLRQLQFVLGRIAVIQGVAAEVLIELVTEVQARDTVHCLVNRSEVSEAALCRFVCDLARMDGHRAAANLLLREFDLGAWCALARLRLLLVAALIRLNDLAVGSLDLGDGLLAAIRAGVLNAHNLAVAKRMLEVW